MRSDGAPSAFSSGLKAFTALFDENGGVKTAGLAGTPGNGDGVAVGESCGEGEQTSDNFSTRCTVGGRLTPFSRHVLERDAGGGGDTAQSAGMNGNVGGPGNDGIATHGSSFSRLLNGSPDQSPELLETPGGAGALYGCAGSSDTVGAWASFDGGDACTINRMGVSVVASGEPGGGSGGSKGGHRLPFGAAGGEAAPADHVRTLFSTQDGVASVDQVEEETSGVRVNTKINMK